MFDYDDGNGVYDVVTRANHERRELEETLRIWKEDKENLTQNEFDQKYNTCPY